MSLSLVTAPTVEPITLAEAKTHLRVDHTDEDALIEALIVAVRNIAETTTRRALATQTWDLKLDGFPVNGGPIYLPLPPVQSVTYVQYVDDQGITRTWSPSLYQVDLASAPARLMPAWEETYPVTRAVLNAVTVRYVAGYGLEPAIPQPIKQAMLLILTHLYEQRSETSPGVIIHEVPMSSLALLMPYRAYGADT